MITKQRCHSDDTERSVKPATQRKRGITLLITLMALVILTAVIIQFQAGTALHVRASSYRIERLQCRYAAESGIVIGTRLVEQILTKPLKLSTMPKPDPKPKTTVPPPPVDSNLSDDPNAIGEFAEIYEPDLLEPEKLPWYVVDRKTIEVGPATVTIEIHDENAKWPLVWLLSSPFERGRNVRQTEQLLRKFADLNQVDTAVTNDVIKLTRTIGQPLKLPRLPIRYFKTKGIYRRRRGGSSYVQDVAKEKVRRKIMADFALFWQDSLVHDPENQSLKKEIEATPDGLAECLGVWGTYRVNINTASPEVLQSAFQLLGLTERQIKSIVKYRQNKPFALPQHLTRTKAIKTSLSNDLRYLSLARSVTYSVHVEAQLGRSTCRLVGGVHKTKTKPLQTQLAAAIPGD